MTQPKSPRQVDNVQFAKVLESWVTPASEYPQASHGDAQLKTCRYKRGFYHMYGVSDEGGQAYQLFEAAKPLNVMTLEIGKKVWMVDDPPHWLGTLEMSQAYRGHVLCAGLGLGLVVHALRRNKAVTQITVVEWSRDVIDLVMPLVSPPGSPSGEFPPVTVYQADWWGISPQRLADDVGRVDGVYFDLLVGDGRQLIGEAFQAMQDMRSRWPGVPHRVFGVNNDMLTSMVADVEAMYQKPVLLEG
jgi:hypothetical protein